MLLRESIERLCVARLNRLPELESPRGFNDCIQWLKLYDQRQEQITACDKWAVRDMVAAIAGPEILIPARRGFPPDRYPCVAKATHDSGSSTRLYSADDLGRVERIVTGRLQKPYGREKGEWAYWFVPPAVIIEDMLPGAPADFKFQCSHDKIRWVRVIRDRALGAPRETIVDADGNNLQLHMDHKMVHDPGADVFPGYEAWAALTDVALKLCRGWRCVRVDLYWATGKVWFGELTFWPMAGCYLTPDEAVLGDMLHLDTSYRLPPICERVP